MKRVKLCFAAAYLGVLAIAASMTAYGAVRLSTPQETFWDGMKATWEEVEDASKYEIRLYRDESYVSSSEVTTKKTSYSYKSRITKEGYYSFRVRAVGKNKNYTTSSWSDYSDELYISAAEAEEIVATNEAERQAKLANVNTGGSGPGDTSGSVKKGAWKQDETGWWYENSDKSYPVSTWQQIDEKWYYFNENGYMATGWLTLEDKMYYCDPEGGFRLTGEHQIDGETKVFDDSGVLQQELGQELLQEPEQNPEQNPEQDPEQDTKQDLEQEELQ